MIVQVTKLKSSRFSFVIDKIMEALRQDNISKDEALQLRERLCEEYPRKRDH